MAYTLDQFARLDLTAHRVSKRQRCKACSAELHESSPSCSDCYWDALSDLVEKSPVGPGYLSVK